MSEWKNMDVEPEDGQLCVVYDPEHSYQKVWPATYRGNGRYFAAGNADHVGWFEYTEVTHWMPLPDAPK